jgi:hypothetical protein
MPHETGLGSAIDPWLLNREAGLFEALTFPWPEPAHI